MIRVMIGRITKYLGRIFISFSIFINVLLGGRNNQTFSARNWQRKKDNKINFVWLIDGIFFWEKGHCRDAWIKWTIINQSITRYHEHMGFSTKRNIWD